MEKNLTTAMNSGFLKAIPCSSDRKTGYSTLCKVELQKPYISLPVTKSDHQYTVLSKLSFLLNDPADSYNSGIPHPTHDVYVWRVEIIRMTRIQ